jgi:GLPGLI family protein
MRIFLVLILFLYQGDNFAQNLSVKYEQNNFGAKFIFLLQSKDSVSSFNYYSNIDGSVESEFLGDVFLKEKTRNFLFVEEVHFGKTFYVKDSLHQMSWKLGKSEKVILGKKCKSATTTFRGRNYTAFYAPKIPVSDGPWKFGGLPGLILEVKSDDNAVQWTAIELTENAKVKISDDFKNIDKSISWEAFKWKFIEATDAHIALQKSKLPHGYTSNLRIDLVEIIYPKLQTGKGIEY